MEIPSQTNPMWEDIVTGRKTCRLQFLAAKILLGRLIRSVNTDRSPENVQASVEQLHAIFANNLAVPSVRDDLASLFGSCCVHEKVQ
jgi:hypothetical protein